MESHRKNREKRADDRHSADQQQQREDSERTPVALMLGHVEFHAANIVVGSVRPRPVMGSQNACALIVLEQDDRCHGHASLAW
ncbi:hypothetical protein F3P66_06350 [Agrobacterium fabrum]|uniref:Uncharacterized protein n=1 Tax=Agrobacterium fabrum (strain C58 / ATCC 33970) TaxID=176299 RepID=Q8U5A3_AGRFC|nr:hypothetical protein Atu1587 [Agrobacterium fabrum str. C58]QRM60611.1 hypothetical protein F3P66_06350 [Agrobacterium fabrum]TRB27119.1 hypothetical protein EXN51_21235 [Agrobacterium fabrum]